MDLLTLGVLVGLGVGEMEPPQAVTPPAAETKPAGTLHFAPDHGCNLFNDCSTRAPFQSDHEFDTFIGPITNPILAKDPRSNTYLLACSSTIIFPTITP